MGHRKGSEPFPDRQLAAASNASKAYSLDVAQPLWFHELSVSFGKNPHVCWLNPHV